MDRLNQFYQDKATCETVKAFMKQVLDREALERVYQSKPTSDLAEAWLMIEKTFTELDALYGEKKKPKIESSR